MELNQLGIQKKASKLITAIDKVTKNDQELTELLAPLREYAEQGLKGKIVSPRTWSGEPLSWEFGEHLLPQDVRSAYGDFAFYTHGLTLKVPRPLYQEGLAYIEVDDEEEVVKGDQR